MSLPIIGITIDNADNTAASGKYESALAYSRTVAEAGALPVLLPHEPQLALSYAQQCDGLILTGGVDPDTTAFGQPLHRRARPMDAHRQAFELAVLKVLGDQMADKPVLGVCLGMQLMALHAGGRLDQYLPDTLAKPQVHEQDRRHQVLPQVTDSVLDSTPGAVVSAHRQAVADAGSMRVVARAHDGVIEAIDDPRRCFYLGVQWHPERGGDDALNRGLIRQMIAAIHADADRHTT
jgi:putative glutamine amidotransferase